MSQSVWWTAAEADPWKIGRRGATGCREWKWGLDKPAMSRAWSCRRGREGGPWTGWRQREDTASWAPLENSRGGSMAKSRNTLGEGLQGDLPNSTPGGQNTNLEPWRARCGSGRKSVAVRLLHQSSRVNCSSSAGSSPFCGVLLSSDLWRNQMQRCDEVEKLVYWQLAGTSGRQQAMLNVNSWTDNITQCLQWWLGPTKGQNKHWGINTQGRQSRKWGVAENNQ